MDFARSRSPILIRELQLATLPNSHPATTRFDFEPFQSCNSSYTSNVQDRSQTRLHYRLEGWEKPATYLSLLSLTHYLHIQSQTISCLSKYQRHFSYTRTELSPQSSQLKSSKGIMKVGSSEEYIFSWWNRVKKRHKQRSRKTEHLSLRKMYLESDTSYTKLLSIQP